MPLSPSTDGTGLTAEQREAAAYVAGMIDGEGSVSVALTGLHAGARYGKRSVRICNTDRDLIDACAEALDLLDIRYRINGWQPRAGHRYAWEIAISRRPELERILAVVPIRSARKRERLGEAVASYCYRASEREPAEAELRSLYLDERLSMRQIGERCGVSVVTVQRWLGRIGVARRGRREAALARSASA